MPRETLDPSRRALLWPGARRVAHDGTPAPQRAVVGEACLALRRIDCRVCGEACDRGAIRFVPRLGGAPTPSVDPVRCNGCGDCLGVCPGAALRLA